MATRNLTKAFISARNGGKANRSILKSEKLESYSADSDGGGSDSGLLNSVGDTVNWKAVKESLPPLWVEKLETVEEDIEKIQNRIKELTGLHTKRLMVNFEVDEEQQEHEIDMKTMEITELFRHSEGLLKKFSKQGDENEISDSERVVRRNMQSQVAKKLQGLSMHFRTTQKQYMKRVQGQKNGSGDNAFDYLGADKVTSSSSGMSTTQLDIDLGFSSAQMLIVDEAEEAVNERDAEIQKIAKSIEELAAIFKELAVLVIDQGTILDRIDYNMETAVEHAKEGVDQLVIAETHQKNATPFRCIVVLILLIIMMLGILIWKHSDSSSGNSNNK